MLFKRTYLTACFNFHRRRFNKYLKKYGLKWPYKVSPLDFETLYFGDKTILLTYCVFYSNFIDIEASKTLEDDYFPGHLYFPFMRLKHGEAVERKNNIIFEKEYACPFGILKISSPKLTEEEKTERKVFEKYLEIQKDRFAHRRRMGEFYREAIKFSDSEDKPDEI